MTAQLKGEGISDILVSGNIILIKISRGLVKSKALLQF